MQYCPQCGDTVSATSAAARIRRLLSNRYLVGALAVVFVVLLAGVLLAGQGQGVPGAAAQAGSVGPLPSPTVTAVVITSTPPPMEVLHDAGAANASGNVTPPPLETVAVVKTLDRYIQNGGGDPSQLRTPGLPKTPTPPSPVPTSASGRAGNLAWSGEGTFVTDPFPLEAGTFRLEMTATVLTMAQLRDAAAGTAIGIATAGPQPATTTIRVPSAGTYRLEIWPFGAGPWTVAISSATAPAAVPTLAPVTATATIPVANVTSEVPTTGAATPAPSASVTPATATTIPTTPINATPTTEPPTTVPTQPPTPTPTQSPRTFTGNGTAATPFFRLNGGLAVFSYSTTGAGNFSVALLDSAGTVTDSIVSGDGPVSGSKAVAVPAAGEYLMNVAAAGPWEISIA